MSGLLQGGLGESVLPDKDDVRPEKDRPPAAVPPALLSASDAIPGRAHARDRGDPTALLRRTTRGQTSAPGPTVSLLLPEQSQPGFSFFRGIIASPLPTQSRDDRVSVIYYTDIALKSLTCYKHIRRPESTFPLVRTRWTAGCRDVRGSQGSGVWRPDGGAGRPARAPRALGRERRRAKGGKAGGGRPPRRSRPQTRRSQRARGG